MNIYVGNLSYKTQEEDLRAAFERFGEVSRVNILSDRDTGQPRGFGFIEMPNAQQGQAAIDGLNGTDLNGRALTVNEARPRTENRAGGGGGGGGRGFGGSGGRGGGGGDRGRRGGGSGGGGYSHSW